ncbi:MAG: nuclear transport factor 2 family protein [Bacteroidetes bacterium]|nr:MAG: nuclear transport factor 2 family protein [Bacteroidota bacterium]
MYRLLVLPFVLCLPGVLPAQVDTSDPLFSQLEKMDSILFEAGFNNCRIDDMEPFISEDLEFFHDQSGVTTSKAEFLQAVRQNICGDPAHKPIRKLVAGSLEVFPLYQEGVLYGAIQRGVHDFYISEPGKVLYQTGTARFTHVWILDGEKWILKRVLSYDHHAPDHREK